MDQPIIKYIDLFAGMGGFRLGFENAFQKAGFQTECVLTSEIKPHAIKTLKENFERDYFAGDITTVPNEFIPDFDFLLAGFPCQPFSASGKRLGFVDTRGTLFFEIERILEAKQPTGFILENVEGLLKHDLENKKDKIGKTLSTILKKLEDLGYQVTYRVLDASNFGIPQARRRIFITGTKTNAIPLEDFKISLSTISEVLESGKPCMDTSFTRKLLKSYPIKDLPGKSIIDKRGGSNNIHSWDIDLKGAVSSVQKKLLNKIFTERRKKQWAKEHGIKWMDGMPLTLAQIRTFFEASNLKELLGDLTTKGYLKYEYPKDLVIEETENGIKKYRKPNPKLEKGYNIVTGKLSFEINKILNPEDIAPTLVATDVSRLAVIDDQGLRRLTVREGLRLFGYPEWYQIPVSEAKAFDLLGNTVVVPMVEAIAQRIAKIEIAKHHQSTFSNIPVCS